MSKRFEQLEETLGLPGMDEIGILQASQEEVKDALKTAQDLEKEFEKINHFDRHDTEMDELAGLAIKAHNELQTLGMNIEIRHAGEIFSSSGAMLRIAVDAKNLKMEKKLKMIRLQIDKQRLDQMSGNDSNVLPGTAVTMDRNEILKQLQLLNGEDK
jgi:hypothetical protein